MKLAEASCGLSQNSTSKTARKQRRTPEQATGNVQVHRGQAVLDLDGGLNYFLRSVFNYATWTEYY